MTVQLEQKVLQLVSGILRPALCLSDDEGLPDLMDAISWDGEALGITDPTVFASAVQVLGDALQVLNEENETETLLDAAKALARLMAALNRFVQQVSLVPCPTGAPADTLTQFTNDLLSFLVERHLFACLPWAASLLEYLGIFQVVDLPEIKRSDGVILRQATQRRKFDLAAISRAFHQPMAYLRDTFLLDSSGAQLAAEAVADLLGPRLADELTHAGLRASYGSLPDLEPPLSEAQIEAANHCLIVGWSNSTESDASVNLRAVLAPSVAAAELSLLFASRSDLTLSMPLAIGTLSLTLTGGVQPLLINSKSISLAGTGGPTRFEAQTQFKTKPEGTPFLCLGSSPGTHFEIGELQASLGISTGSNGIDINGKLDLKSMLLAINGAEGDGFLSYVLPSNPIELRADVGIDASARRGLGFRGSGSLQQAFPLETSIGPIGVLAVEVTIRLANDTFGFEITGTLGVSVGPVNAIVKSLGLQATLRATTATTDNLGLDLAFGFKPPSGVGLAIDATGVKGGGRLDIDDGNYAGLLNLDIQETIAITAIGILTTRLPDGSKIFSLKVFGMIEFPPIQLGFGFFISGIGLAVAIECTMNTDALRNSVYTGSLTSILFPPEPAKNATKVIADLKSFFPPKQGNHVFGAMANLGWGGATSLIKLSIGVFVEIERTSVARIALAGDTVCALPTEDDAILHIEMQIIGILDIANSTLSIDAALVNSYLTVWTLAGGMALRTAWGETPRFALAVGGFFPGYRAPDGFPALVRLSISLGNDNPRIGLFCYMAITENSVQFGAALLFYYSVDIWLVGFFEVDGALGFDALIRFSPFSFEADLFARLTLKRDHDTLCGIDIYLYLSGPNDYHAVSHAKLEVCGISLKVEFDQHFGDHTKELPSPLASPLQALLQEINNPKNWEVTPSTWGTSLVTLRDADDAKAYVDTSGGLRFHQRAVPLQFTIAKLGEAVIPAGEDYFDIVDDASFKLTDVEDVQDSFAPGQFARLSDQEKISAPPFESMKSGIEFSSHRIAAMADSLGNVVSYGKSIGYRTIHAHKAVTKMALLKPESKEPLEPSKPSKSLKPKTEVIDPGVLTDWKTLAGRRYHLSDVARTKSKGEKIAVKEQKFAVITSSASGGRFKRANGAGDMTFAHARQAKAAAVDGDLEIVGSSKAEYGLYP